jgi:PAS domain S-box-containing protein
MPTKHPVKPSARNKKTAAPAKAPRSGRGRPETPKLAVADRKRADAQPREGEKLYSSLFVDNVAVMLIIDPADGRIIDANRAASRFYGYTLPQLRALNISDINTLPQKEIRIEMRKARAEKRNYFIFSHRLADGAIRDVEVNSGPILLEGRKLLYSIVHDITQRKRADDALRESEQRYRLLVDNAEIAVVVTSLATGHILFANERAANVFEISRSEAIGRQARDHWVRAEDRDRFVAELSAKGG